MQTAECRVAIERLLAYSDNPTIHRAAAEAALAHVRGCPYCQRRLGPLALALASDEEDQLTCQQCQDRLPEYLQAELQGQAHDPQWHPIALHLEQCPHCAAVYAELAELATLADGEHGTEPPHYPAPRLSFLGSERAAPSQPANKPWQLDTVGRLVIAFSAELLRALQPPMPPALAGAGIKSGTASRMLYQFALKEDVEDREITITVEQTQGDPTDCAIIVQVDIPSLGGWPHLAGTEITLSRGAQELEMQTTDAFGKALFSGIAVTDLPQLTFTISSTGPAPA